MRQQNANNLRIEGSGRSEDCAYVSLWRGVVLHAIRDALQFDEEAIRWLLFDKRDAHTVFGYANMDVSYARPRIRSLIVLMALTVARGREPRFQKNKVVWSSPAKIRRIRAQEFLTSTMGQRMRVSAALPTSQFDRDQLLANAILLSRGRDEQPLDESAAALEEA